MILRPVWRLRDLPELSHLSEGERIILLRRCVSRRSVMRLWMLSMIIGIPPAIIVYTATDFEFGMVLGMVAGTLAWAFFAGCVFQVVMFFIRVAVRNAILDASTGRRLPACLKCGYDALGAASDRCPECGALLQASTHRGGRPPV